MIKKSLCLLLAGLMCITSFDISALAKEEEYIEVTEKNVEEIVSGTAIEWAKLMEPGKELIVTDIKEVYNVATDKMEYTASLFDNVTPYGYVVVGVYDGEMVVLEGNVNKGQEGIYTDTVEQIVKSEGRPRRKIEIEESLTKLGPMSYGLGYKNGKEEKAFKDKNGQSIAMEGEMTIRAYETYGSAKSIFISKYSWHNSKYAEVEGTKIILKKYDDRDKLYSSDESSSLTKRYACGIQALTQIARMEKLRTDDPNEYKVMYNKLWKLCNTKTVQSGNSTKNKNVDGVELGENTVGNLILGFWKYCAQRGYELKGSSEKNPSVKWLKDNLMANRSILMAYTINVKNQETGKTEKSSHGISILGYVRAKKVSSGKTYNYLMVYDGWNPQPYYLNYATVDLVDCKAVSMYLKKVS